ncbi:MAG TPA: DUF6098 family protein [Pseudonocardiaceae bacterium]|jgi:hypothetical protein
MDTTDLPTVHDLDGLVDLVREFGDGHDLYVRWSTGPADDLRHDRVSATPLRIEPWWGSRSPRLWLARRLFDYRHLKDLRGPGVRAWVLAGDEVGRGPDNEPLVACHRPLAWIGDAVLAESAQVVIRQRAGAGGSQVR